MSDSHTDAQAHHRSARMPAGVERRIDVDAFNRAGELLFQRLKGEQIVSEDEAVVE